MEAEGRDVRVVVVVGSFLAGVAASETGDRWADEICWAGAPSDSAAASAAEGSKLRMTRAGFP